MSPPRPLAAFKLLCAAAYRFISHSVPSVRESLCRVADIMETAAAEAAPPAATAAQTKAPKKKTKVGARNKAAGPTLGKQIDKIVAGCPDKRGMSAIAIKKALAASGVNVAKRSAQIRFSIKRKVKKGSLLQTRGVGFSDTFKAAKEKSSLKLANKAKKPAAKKVVKKKPAIKKTAAKKSVARKVGAKQSPNKKQGAKKPAAKKAGLKKAKNPRKVAAPKAKVVKKSAKNKPKAAKPKKAAGKKK
ncbi:LOW QUALITY PROTEIN: histone H1-like [Pristis pectinata]|uniref:LOW QUALITY PROTEIN: histone H1-like n=1 Tax=Pristis pectinata TaxID=685728 RepID=UPI00223E6C86|nr:LOW QUALITY PROTEIN: histone H1-like [Pristis pectinata]